MDGFVEPGRDVVARGVPVVRYVSVVARYDQQEAPVAIGELHDRISRRQMELDDRRTLSADQHERHVGTARTALVSRDDDTEAAFGRELQRALLLLAKLGSK